MAHDLKIMVQSFSSYFAEAFGFSGKKNGYTKEIMLAVLFCALVGGGYFGYRMYVNNREQMAQKIFSDYLQDYQAAVQADSPSEWARIEQSLQYGFEQQSHTYMAPYFLALLAEAYVKQNKNDLAVATLAKAIDASKNDTIKQMYSIKRALIQIDSSDESVQDQGLHVLIEESKTKNNFTDMALFYLGKYYWVKNSTDDAKKVWQQLVDMKWTDQSNTSAWVTEASTMLKQIG